MENVGNTIAIMNQKGGVGKTTLTLILAHGLAEESKRVLIVDLDPQGVIAIATGQVDENRRPPENINRMFQIDETVITPLAPNIDGILGGQKTANAAYDIATSRSKDCLKVKLDEVSDDYDFILIDMPPTTTPFTPAVMFAADHLVMPTTLDSWSLDGLQRVIEFWVLLKRDNEKRPNFLGVVPIKVSKAQSGAWTNEEKARYEELSMNYPERLLWPYTSLSTVWAKAAEQNLTVFTLTEGSPKAIKQARQQANAIVQRFLEELGYGR